MSRRQFLELLGMAGVSAALGGACSGDDSPGAQAGSADGPTSTTAPSGPPTLGVASARWPDGVMAGDPRTDGTVLWTRLAPDSAPDEVLWEVAEDLGFERVVAGGVAATSAARDHTVKVLVDSLASDSWFYYRFATDAGPSPIGRLRTAPAPGASVDRLRFAFASCQQINDSLYVAHRAIAQESDLDLWMHLGDYVYVSDTDTVALDDYRGVYHRFKENELLQLVQATLPTVAMFDDGEFYNGVDRFGPPERLEAAKAAWFETMPVMAPDDDPSRAYRSLAWGALAELFMIDVRSYRDPEVAETDTATAEGAQRLLPGRTTLGEAQRAWLFDGLGSSPGAWRVLGNPYNMSMNRIEDRDPGPPRPPGALIGAGNYFPNEAWDDFSVERRELLEHLVERGIANVVSVSGHTHVFIASELRPDFDDPASPLAAWDFTTGSLTADPDLLAVEGTEPDVTRAGYRELERVGLEINPHLRYLNFVDQGYGVVELTPERTTVEFKFIDPFDPDAEARVGARFVLERDQQDLAQIEAFDDARR